MVATALTATACIAVVATPQDNATVDAVALKSWTAQVVRIVDGDTVEVTIGNDPEVIVVRIAGLQTNEVFYYDPRPSECYSAEATQRLTELLSGKRVELLARSESSKSYGRPIRHVLVGGKNVARTMLREGFGIPVAFNEEPDFEFENTNQALLAARDKIGVWDDDYCGVGPAQNAKIEMMTNYDAPGDDSENINGEYVQLRNRGTQTIGFNGWQIRDTALRRFEIPSGYTLAPGGRLRIFVGQGTNTSDKIFLGQTIPILGNVADGIFLYDSDFDIRAYDMWPCAETCPVPDPLSIEKVNYDAPGDDLENPNGEYIRLRNNGSKTIDFQDWMLEVPPIQLTSVASRKIAPGQSLTIYIGKGTNTSSKMYLQQSAGILNNSQHLVVLYDPERAVVDCDARGEKFCPSIQQAGSSLGIQGPSIALRPAVRINR